MKAIRFFHFLMKLFSSFFFVGLIPPMPGTYASLLACLIYLASGYLLYFELIMGLGFFCLGLLTSRRAKEIWGSDDPSSVVIDEAAGMFLSLSFLPPSWLAVWLAFLLFRFFDITKIWGIRRLQAIPWSWGIMLDDLVAGLYTNLILQVVFRLILKSGV